MSIYETDYKFFDTNEYRTEFFNQLRTGHANHSVLEAGLHSLSGSLALPAVENDKYNALLLEEDIFRRIATVVQAPKGNSTIHTFETDDVATWLGDGTLGDSEYHVGADTFHHIPVSCHRLGTVIRCSVDFVSDIRFDLGDYLARSFAKRIGHTERAAFVNGTGVNMPTGILHETAGSQTGVTAAGTTSVTYDEVISLFFSVDAEYRDHGVWMINDSTALALRKLKDENGAYLWNHANDTILGKPVCICNNMPNMESGKKPIAFGDFSYYWIVQRMRFTTREMVELYANYNQIGFLGYEHLDAKLIRREAIKVIQMGASGNEVSE